MRETEMPLVDPNDDGIRPAGKPNECLYCKQKVGSRHLATCACVTKRIKARYTYEIELEIPYSWSAEDFEFHRNDSSWCSDNSIRELENFAKHLEESGMSCMCCIDGAFTAEFVPAKTGFSKPSWKSWNGKGSRRWVRCI